MNPTRPRNRRCLALAGALAALPAPALAFDSGSTGADGAFTPQVDTELQLPPDGIFNFTTVDIPEGVTVRFKRNPTNTPVVVLASGDVTIEGTISVSGTNATDAGTAGGGNLGDDGLPGRGGPGGFDGGRGGTPGETESDRIGSPGLGPGGGGQARGDSVSTYGQGAGGGGAGFAESGEPGSARYSSDRGLEGASYGTDALLPIIGGSGGGGASAGKDFGGSGGGGGGGALLIATSGTLHLASSGRIFARGGWSGRSTGVDPGGRGGGGSGGAIRLVASTLSGNGEISATGGGGDWHVSGVNNGYQGGDGSDGRIRLEAETMLRTAATDPDYSFGEPGSVFVAGMPTLRIASVAGTDAPAAPTGSADIVLPEDTPNPVTVTFQASGIPLGNTVTLKVVPASGAATEAVSNALDGSESSATAEVEIDIPDGPSVLQASVSFTVVEDSSLSANLSRFTNGEPVAKVTVDAGMDGSGTTKLVTVSGSEYTWHSNAVAMQ